MEKARQQFEETGKAVQLFGEFQYQAGTWAEPQRIIFKAEHNEKGPNTRFIVTDLTHSSRRFIYQTVYCGRGTMELMIKDHKNHLYSDRTSCCRFEANQLRLFLHSMAYVLMHTFRTVYLSQTQFAKAQFDTIRLKLLKIGARVRELCTKVKIHLPSSFPYQKEFFTIWQSCCLPAYT
jgi:hypothetical protein